VKEKFDTVIEAFNMVKERLDRHDQAEEERFQRPATDVNSIKVDVAILKTDVSVLKTDVSILKTDVGVLKKDVAGIRNDLNEHRDSTELHGGRVKKEAS
jgi:hypothetical protein